MKVAVVIERYDISLGGAERLVFELVSALSRLGLDVQVLTAKANNSGANIHALCGNYPGKRVPLVHFGKVLKQYLGTNHFDIVHSLIPLSFADVYQPPNGTFVEAKIRHTGTYQSKLMALYKKATAFTNRRRAEALREEKKLCRNPNGPIIAALSEYVKKQFKVHYDLEDKRIVVIPDGVNTDRQIDPTVVEELRSRIFHSLAITQTNNKPTLILFGANNFRRKGLYVLIRALELLSKSGTPNLPYLIVIGNDRHHKYLRLAKTLRIENRILFLGFLSDIQNVITLSDVAVLPTFYDPSSRFILEALAFGKPVITTRFNGATDSFVNNRHGKVINRPDDAAELAQAIVHFMNPENVQKASQAILADNLKQKVSINRVAGQLVSLYESILQKKGQHPCMQCTSPQLS